MEIEAIGSCSLQNNTKAVPPRVTKTGTPIKVAASNTTNAGMTRVSEERENRMQTRSAAPAMAAEASRPAKFSDACHTNLAVRSANPNGMTSCTTQTGMPSRIFPASLSDITN